MTEPATTGASADAIELLTSQHAEVEQLWSQLQAAHEAGAGGQAELAQHIVSLLSQHDALETQLLYPELHEHGGEAGRRMSEHGLEEHQQVRDLLEAVDGADIADEAVFTLLSRAMGMVIDHVAEEEEQMFPVLRRACGQERLSELGEEMARAKKLAPTHPHPSTPNSKLGATIAGAVSGVVDRARDAVRQGRPR